MVAGDRFDPVEFAATMNRLTDRKGYGDEVIKPKFDPVQFVEARAEAEHGRRIQDYVTALERAGFVFWPANSIPPGCLNPLMEGQWRRRPDRRVPRRIAMTDSDVSSWFPEGPEQLWTWLQKLSTDAHQPQQVKRIFSQCPGIHSR